MWSINGTPVASVNTALGAHSPLQQILCVSFSTMYEWDAGNVIMTGSSDGVVRVSRLCNGQHVNFFYYYVFDYFLSHVHLFLSFQMWGIEYVQVPADDSADNNNSNSSSISSDQNDSANNDNKTEGNEGRLFHWFFFNPPSTSPFSFFLCFVYILHCNCFSNVPAQLDYKVFHRV